MEVAIGPRLSPKLPLYRSVEAMGLSEVDPKKPSWDQAGTLELNADCKTSDTTASTKKPKQINKAESSADSLLALTSMALQHATNNKKRTEG